MTQDNISKSVGKEPQNTRAIGRVMEQKAVSYLENSGYQILQQNFSCKMGEVDIIAMHDDVLVFVEVKYRATKAFGHPFAAVDHKKQKRICNVAAYFVYTHRQYAKSDIRFDVVSITGEEVLVYQNAFPYSGSFRR